MEGFVKQSLLYDFYGDLLTEHQKHIYELYVLDNLSLGEIAEDEGISRQGVHDIIKRCNAQLEGYEAKLKLVEKFISIREKVETIQNCGDLDEARDLARQILEML
jgi:uncharacterized protein